ncbi:Serine/threonine-protein phosphatase 4 regulatory subunit 3 [Toxocara canis]|uniref:Serine/threonine-protein phosphatase 4 regulatory subunit 3 n=1 Tax=Toxocara canis TaxID=6265 RepID=A0A0B2VXQ1_TOXCA|nr:Serine/threonine-protein phosphatase 4 regulatory subunit 3 [Toxocara canis]
MATQELFYHTPVFCESLLDETLIVWSESDTCDLALSFQDKSGCEHIWEKICQVQGRDPEQHPVSRYGA